jgi:hypothetical protein
VDWVLTGFWAEAMHGLVRLSGQAGEDVGEIRFGIDAFAVAVADQERVRRRFLTAIAWPPWVV